MRFCIFIDKIKKIKSVYYLSFFLVFLKSFGGLLFSWFLILFKGDLQHVAIIKDLSAIIGFSILIRFGSDAAILKLATIYYDAKKKKALYYLFFISLALCLVNSFILFSVLCFLYSFDTVSVLQAVVISGVISINFCLASFLKTFGKINHSFYGDAGMVMILSLPLIFFNFLEPLISLGFIWFFISLCYIFIYYNVISSLEDSIEFTCYKKLNGEFFGLLPNLFINSVINYIQQWGIIYFSTFSLALDYASSFILIVRASYIFNAVLSPLASYTVPEVIRRYKNGGSESVNEYIKTVSPLYKYSSLICLLIASSFSIYSIYPNLGDYKYILSFLFFLSCCAFSTASGPVNMYMAVLGFDSLLVKIRLFMILPFVLIIYFLEGNLFIISCAFYLLMQRFFLVILLRKKSGIYSI